MKKSPRFTMVMVMTAIAMMLCLSACSELPSLAKKDDPKGFGVAPRKTDENQPQTAPILMVETGMHTDVIRRIGVDAKESILVTGSNDKTVRIWDIATGELKKF